MKRLLLLFALATLPVAADTLDEALKKYSTLPEGRIRFHIVPAAGEAQAHDAVLAFKRPDRLHFWEAGGGGPETHIWLDAGKMWLWTSQLTPDPNSQKNIYLAEPHEGPLSAVERISPFGPALFVLQLMTGQRSELALDPRRRSGYYTKEGDQLIFDPATHLLKEIVAYRDDKIVARARVTTETVAPPAEELTWKLPAGARLLEEEPAQEQAR